MTESAVQRLVRKRLALAELADEVERLQHRQAVLEALMVPSEELLAEVGQMVDEVERLRVWVNRLAARF